MADLGRIRPYLKLGLLIGILVGAALAVRATPLREYLTRDGIVFTLEVSSAGLDRPLTRLADFERFTGFKAKAETRHLVDGRRRYSGIIAGVEGDQIVLRTEDGEPESNDEARLNFGDLAKAKLVATDELFELAKAGKLPRPVAAPAAAAEPTQTTDPNDPTTGQDPES